MIPSQITRAVAARIMREYTRRLDSGMPYSPHLWKAVGGTSTARQVIHRTLTSAVVMDKPLYIMLLDCVNGFSTAPP